MIVVDNIRKSFGGVAALNGCSLAIADGSITGLIGPNGAGKSTLFDVIAGTKRADGGIVKLDGVDITNVAEHRRVPLGLVRTFQVPQEFPRLSVRENLMMVPPNQTGEHLFFAWTMRPRIRAEDAEIRAKADDVLAFLSLDALADAPAGSLSGGQKKLLELGRTMMLEPKIVLLDEPGAGVNRFLLAKLVEAIRRLNAERGYTFCIIEHDMDLVAELCDPVIVMAEGRVLAQGTMAEVRHDARVLDAYFGGGRQKDKEPAT
jgi:branched-chain amino acid transport system ATP-binding protein